MAFSIEQLGEIDKVIGQWCVSRVPPELKSQIDHDYEIDGQAVTLFEVRPMWRGAPGELTRNPFVRFRQAKTTGIRPDGPLSKITFIFSPSCGLTLKDCRKLGNTAYLKRQGC